jgi:hypothetical protein
VKLCSRGQGVAKGIRIISLAISDRSEIAHVQNTLAPAGWIGRNCRKRGAYRRARSQRL